MKEQDTLSKIAVPQHIGIIMDGNGRWALLHNIPRTQGHLEGLKAAKLAVKSAIDLGVRYLSLYVFSTENWNRVPKEVKFLMGILATRLRKEYDFCRRHDIRVVHSGNLQRLPKSVQRELELVEKDTCNFDTLTVNLAVNYGGRDEIVRAIRRWRMNGEANEEFTQETLMSYLDHPAFPDPDLIIRTGKEYRISNFLLWECAYSEFIFSDKLWPDWNYDDMFSAVHEFRKRKRSFGGMR